MFMCYFMKKPKLILKFMQITLTFNWALINSLSPTEGLTKALVSFMSKLSLVKILFFFPAFKCIITKYSLHVTFALIMINLYCSFTKLLPERVTLYTYVHTHRNTTQYFLLQFPSNEKALEPRLAVMMLNFPKTKEEFGRSSTESIAF